MRVATLAIVLLLVPSLAPAQGINLAWDDCTLGSFSHDKSPTCDTDIGPPFKLIVSVDPGGVIGDLNGAQGIVDFQFDAAGVPDYWRLDTGGCRQGKLTADIAVGSANAPFSCPEPWSQVGGAAGGANLVPFVGGPNRARITWIVAVPGTVVLDDSIAPDWYLIALNILRSGTTTCSGCLVPACIVANEVRLTKPANTPGGDVFIYSAAHSQFATWRGGGTLGCPGCPADAYCPVENVTWGKVKSMFR